MLLLWLGRLTHPACTEQYARYLYCRGGSLRASRREVRRRRQDGVVRHRCSGMRGRCRHESDSGGATRRSSSGDAVNSRQRRRQTNHRCRGRPIRQQIRRVVLRYILLRRVRHRED